MGYLIYYSPTMKNCYMGYGYASNGHVYLEHQNLRESDAPGSSSKLSHPDDSSSTRKTYGW